MPGRLKIYGNGRSMYPFFRGVEHVEVIPAPIRNVNRGEVVAFWSGERLIVHRVVGKICENGAIKLVTRGDANREVDGALVESGRIIGRVVRAKGKNRLFYVIGLNRVIGRLIAELYPLLNILVSLKHGLFPKKKSKKRINGYTL